MMTKGTQNKPYTKYNIPDNMNTSKINLCHLNVYWLLNKVPDINILLNRDQHDIHLLGLTETKITQDPKIPDSLLEIENYKLIRKDKTHTFDTGIAIYIKNSIYNNNNVTRRTDLETKEIESIWLQLKFGNNAPMLIFYLYKNPAIKISEWQNNFEIMMDKLPNKKQEIMLLGDFNINLKRKQTSWNSTITSLGLEQIITKNTRVTDKTQTYLITFIQTI